MKCAVWFGAAFRREIDDEVPAVVSMTACFGDVCA